MYLNEEHFESRDQLISTKLKKHIELLKEDYKDIINYSKRLDSIRDKKTIYVDANFPKFIDNKVKELEQNLIFIVALIHNIKNKNVEVRDDQVYLHSYLFKQMADKEHSFLSTFRYGIGGKYEKLSSALSHDLNEKMRGKQRELSKSNLKLLMKTTTEVALFTLNKYISMCTLMEKTYNDKNLPGAQAIKHTINQYKLIIDIFMSKLVKYAREIS